MIEKALKHDKKASEWFERAWERMPESDRNDPAKSFNELAAYAITEYENAPRSLPQAIFKWVQDFFAGILAFITEKTGYVPKNLSADDLSAIALRFLESEAKALMQGESAQVETLNNGQWEPDSAAFEEAKDLPDPLSESFKKTERAYGGKTAWERAKSAGRTKLNYRQWVQVRTPEFKNWFGDWEAASHRQFLEGEPVSELTGKEFEPDGVPLTDKVPKWFDEEHDGLVTSPELGEVILDKDGVKTSLGHGKMRRDKAAGFAAVPDIIASGRVLNRSDNWKGRGYATALIAAPVEIGGRRFVGAVVVKQTDRQRFHLEDVFLLDDLQEAASKTGAVAGSSAVGLPGAASGDIVNVLLPIFQSNPDSVSKVVDEETGEPKVVYHGTDADFEVFDAKAPANNPYLWNDNPLGFFFTSNAGRRPDSGRWSGAAGFAGVQQRDGETVARSGANIMPVFLDIKNPMPVDNTMRDGEELRAIAEIAGHDGVKVGDEVFVAFSPNQIKSATGNSGAFSRENDSILYQQPAAGGSSRSAIHSPQSKDDRSMEYQRVQSAIDRRNRIFGASGRNYTDAQRRAFLKVGRETTTPPVRERVATYWKDIGKRLRQGVFDQFAPILDLDPKAYLFARMSKGSAGTLEAMLMYGRPFVRDGVYDAIVAGWLLIPTGRMGDVIEMSGDFFPASRRGKTRHSRRGASDVLVSARNDTTRWETLEMAQK